MINKYRITRKTVSGLPNVFRVGYCDLQHLLNGLDPVAYNSGVYGWNFDLYHFNGIYICTGYRNLAGATIENKSEWNKKALEITLNPTATRKDLEALQAEFAADLLAEEVSA